MDRSAAQDQSRLSPGGSDSRWIGTWLGRLGLRARRAELATAPGRHRRRPRRGCRRSTPPVLIDVETARQPDLPRALSGRVGDPFGSGARRSAGRLRRRSPSSAAPGPGSPPVAPASAGTSSDPSASFTRSSTVGGHLVQCLQVLGHQVGGPAKRVPHPAAEDVLEQRQHLAAQPHPGERRIGVVRVLPRRQTGRSGRSPRWSALRHAEQRSAPRWPPGPHPGDRPRARPAGQPEQHRLGLVVGGVREQHGARPVRASPPARPAAAARRTWPVGRPPPGRRGRRRRP